MKKIFVRFKNGSEARYDMVVKFGLDPACGFFSIELSNGVRISINKDEVLFIEECTDLTVEKCAEPDEDFMNEPVEE